MHNVQRSLKIRWGLNFGKESSAQKIKELNQPTARSLESNNYPRGLSIILQLRSRKSTRMKRHGREDYFQRTRCNITKIDSIWSRMGTAGPLSLKEMRGEGEAWNDLQGEATQNLTFRNFRQSFGFQLNKNKNN